ncbi:hypothetical protein AN960_09335 [Bacillus sp. FJAT-25509]|uniref:hypothetical protein n=1 Tax=Bacillus sp. FJAT-25509 TaxID=1712029 RepID=UPI0006F2CEB9|nr:hypothetical protein [Bacillus sp. FJAT-25509]KQL39174.1 hypothetical protein AN960_09335 [Bacillus sp. FJAT-25509]
MLVFVLHILISFMVLGISLLLPVQTVKYKISKLNNITGIYGILGIVIVGIGIFIGGGESLHEYIYITFIIQLIILGLLLLVNFLNKKVGYSKLKSICSLCLITISLLFYIYYIIASFIYY